MNLQNIVSQIESIVREAGCLALEKRVEKQDIHTKGAADYVTETDLAINRMVSDRLLSLLPGSGILSEEEPAVNTKAEYVWVLDPIDGTSNLIFDLRLSALSICLLQNEEPVLGVVYNPFSQELFSAIKGEGAYLNHSPIHVNAIPALEKNLISVGTTPYNKAESAQRFATIQRIFERCIDIRRLGSAALDICYVACGRYGGFFEHQLQAWDFSGAAIILMEAGGTITDFSAKTPAFKRPSGIVASNGTIHSELLKELQHT